MTSVTFFRLIYAQVCLLTCYFLRCQAQVILRTSGDIMKLQRVFYSYNWVFLDTIKIKTSCLRRDDFTCL